MIGFLSAARKIAVPKRTRRVRAPTAARVVSASIRGRAVRLSPTHTELNPSASVRSAICIKVDGSDRPDITASRVGSKTPKFIVERVIVFSLRGATDQACHVVFHDRFAALILYPLAITHDTAAARGHRLSIENFDLDLDRVADFHRTEKAHLV